MSTDFCPGYHAAPFRSLAENYPGHPVYHKDKFRVEWGPIFHRGRLDGSARVLVIGQDPAQHEGICRRILVGAAGQRVQGYLAKLGITRSYVMVNTFLYSVAPGNSGSSSIDDPVITTERNRWLDAIFEVSGTGAARRLEAVITFGMLARKAWQKWTAAKGGVPSGLAVANLTHPTADAHFGNPDTSSSAATKLRNMLDGWNAGLDVLRPAISHPDVTPIPTTRYGTRFIAADLAVIPPCDLPPGLPAFMRDASEAWAVRDGRPRIIVTAPPAAIAAPSTVPSAVALAAPTGPIVAAAQAARPAARRRGLSALKGTVVTMKPGAAPLPNHTVYIRDGVIVAVQPSTEAAPGGFAGIPAREAGGFIFPGFIELHNHLPYNALPLWSVPRKFEHRGQWRDHADYRRLITGPMKTIVTAGGEALVAAVCRYVECKALFGGTTTSQGVTLSSAGTARTHLRGLLRNAESTDDPDLNSAGHTIDDFSARTVEGFYSKLKQEDSCYIMHLAEGVPSAARKHFLGLKRPGKSPRFAITKNLCCIHSTGLEARDFQVMADLGGTVVWSPLSNLLLYGETTNIKAALAAGVNLTLGADWSPSGSKSILGELKIARAYCDWKNINISDEEILALVTRNAAKALKWTRDGARAGTGTLEVGNIADITVIKGTSNANADPYKAALKADETDIRLVMLGGEARFGVKQLVEQFTDSDERIETVRIGGVIRAINLQPTNKRASGALPELDDLTLAEATSRLKTAFANLPELQAAAPSIAAFSASAVGSGRPRWTLALDEIEDTGFELRPLKGLPGRNTRSLTKLPPATAGAQAVRLRPVRLDPLTVVDDPPWLKAIAAAKNIPSGMKAAIKTVYA
ncbi:MAG: amidohydrolase family protein [Phycisphaerales bacterium]